VVTVIQFLFRRVELVRQGLQTCSLNAQKQKSLRQEFLKFCGLNHESNAQFYQRMLWVPICVVIGALVYYSWRSEPSVTWLTICVAALAGAALLVARLPSKSRPLPGFLIFLAGVVLFGFLYSAFITHTFRSTPVKAPIDRVMVEGWLEEMSGSGSSIRYLIDVQAVSGMPASLTPEKVRLTVRGDSDLKPGRFIRCYASLRPPPAAILPGDYNFAQQAYFQKLGAVGFVYGRCNPGRLSSAPSFMNGLEYRIHAQRRSLAERISQTNHSSRGSALAAAVMTGDRSFLSEKDEENLQASGLAHLLAISGLHMGLAAGAFFFVLFRLLALVEPLSLRFPVQKLAGVGAILAITVYLIFSGASISTQRAYVMLGVALLFGLMDRPVVSFQALAFAMFVVVLLSPWAVTTPGFQMSFAATAALIAAYRHRLKSEKFFNSSGLFGRFREFAYGIFLTSWVAGLATLPFALYHFDRAAPLGFIANLVVMPIVTIASVPLASITAILLPFGLEGPSLSLLARSLDLVLGLAEFFADDRGLAELFSLGRIPLFSAILASAALIIWIVHGKSYLFRAAIISAIAILIWVFTPHPFLVYDGVGHLFVRSNKHWMQIDTGVRGLDPLRYVDVPDMACETVCSVAVGKNTQVSYSPTLGDLVFQNGENITILPSDMESQTGFSVFASGRDAEIRYHPDLNCRPWSLKWPDCRE